MVSLNHNEDKQQQSYKLQAVWHYLHGCKYLEFVSERIYSYTLFGIAYMDVST